MHRLGHLTLAVTLGALLAACNHSTPSATTSNGSAASTELVKPTATADENTWGNYLAEQGKLHGKDVGMRPYIYVIPASDSAAAASE